MKEGGRRAALLLCACRPAGQRFLCPSAHIQDMPCHICPLVLSADPAARVVESSGGFSVLRLPGGGLKVLSGPSLAGRVHCAQAGPFSPCMPGTYPADAMVAGLLARLRTAAVGEAAGMGARHTARAEVLSGAAAELMPGLDAEDLLAAARRLEAPFPVRMRTAEPLGAQQCRRLSVSFLSRALQLRPSVVPVPDRIPTGLDQQAEARHDLLIDLSLAAGAGLACPSPGVRARLDLLLSEGRTDAGQMLQETWDEQLWA